MEKKPGAIALIVGGALMAVASLMTWLTVKLDVATITAAIKAQTGVDVSAGFANAQTSKSAAGTSGWEGKLALLVGIAALVVGIVVIVASMSPSVASRVGFVTGAIGILVAVEAILTRSSGIDDAKAASASAFAGSTLTPSIFDNAIKVSIGIGVYLTIIGGIVAIIGGVMLMGKETSGSMPMAASSAPPVGGSGFDAPAAAPTPPPMPTTPPADGGSPMGDGGGGTPG